MGPFELWRSPHRLPASRCAAALLLGVISAGIASSAGAEVRIEGTVAALRVTTGNDAVSDVLSALAAACNLRYRTTVRLDAAAGARYSGSLGEVIGQLLDGYSYVIRKDHDVFDLLVVGSNGGRPVAAPAPAPPAAPRKTIASQWR
jgi:hypothetical protein